MLASKRGGLLVRLPGGSLCNQSAQQVGQLARGRLLPKRSWEQDVQLGPRGRTGRNLCGDRVCFAPTPGYSGVSSGSVT